MTNNKSYFLFSLGCILLAFVISVFSVKVPASSVLQVHESQQISKSIEESIKKADALYEKSLEVNSVAKEFLTSIE